MHSPRYILGFVGLLACSACSTASAAPGQAGWLFPSPVPDGRIGDRTGETWHARAAVGGGFAWFLDEESHGLTFLEAGAQPVPGLQIAGGMSLQVDGSPRLDPAYLMVSATIPSEVPTKVAVQAGAGGFGPYAGGGIGLAVGNQHGRVGWDLGWVPLAVSVNPKWGWEELSGGDRTPAWDFELTWMTLHGGLTAGLSEHWTLRVGVPDGLVFSYQRGHFTLDVGGGALFYLFGAVGLKAGGRF